MFSRISLLCGVVFLFVLVSMPGSGMAFEAINKTSPGNFAAHGYDVVSYFDAGGPMEGDKQYRIEWKGVVWQFSSVENRDRFLATPEAFAPQYGGYCSNQMSLGNLSDIDPEVWMIVDDKLYLFGHNNGRKRWLNDTLEKINSADANWKRRVSETAGG